MSDPNRKLEPEPVEPPPAPKADDIQKTKKTTTSGADILPGAADYPPYLLVVKLTDNGQPVAHINGPHTSAALDLGQATTRARVRVTHNATAEGPNLTVIIERA
jgi:hypothetical protein